MGRRRIQLWAAQGIGHVAVGLSHFGRSFGFSLLGEVACFSLCFDGFGAFGLGV